MSNFAPEKKKRMDNSSDFDTIFRQYYEPLFHFAHQFVDDEDECHDIVSSAYETVWTNFASIEKENVRQFLYTIVRNRAIDSIRKSSKHRSYIEYASTMSQHEVTSDRLGERDDEMRIIEQLYDDLGSPTAEILRACYVEDKKYREVAEEMGISIATVKKHIIKALARIREIKKNLKL